MTHSGRTIAMYGGLCALAWGAVWYSAEVTTPRDAQPDVLYQGDLSRMTLMSPGQVLVLDRTRSPAWLTVKTSNTTRRYIAQPDKTSAIVKALSPLRGERLAAGSTKDLSLYGLSPNERSILMIGAGHTATTLYLGAQTFGQRGFYVSSKRAPQDVFMVQSPALRWLRFGQSHLPYNHIHPLGYGEIQQIDVSVKDKQLKMRQRQLDTPEFAYWSWETRTGASREARRWVKALLRLRTQGPVVRLEMPPDEVMTIALTTKTRQRLTVRFGKHDGAAYVTSSWLNNNWFAINPGAYGAFIKRWPALLNASRDEALYTPPKPGQSAHKGHAH